MTKTTRILSTVLLSAAATAGASGTAHAGKTAPDDAILPSSSAATAPAKLAAKQPATAAASLSATHAADYRLPADATVGGVALKTGSYRVVWSGEGSDVQVSLHQGKRELVKVAGTVLALDRKAEGDTVMARPTASGVPVATEIRFAGKKVALRLADEAAGAVTADAAPRGAR